MDGVRHRAGPLKQANKSFKGGRHRRKRAVERSHGSGRTESVRRVSTKGCADAAHLKANRLNRQKQTREKAKEEAMRRHLQIGGPHGPPRVIALIALGHTCNLRIIRTKLLSACGVEDGGIDGPVVVAATDLKQRFVIYETPRDLESILDIAKVADTLAFVMPVSEGVDALGHQFISALHTQGTPSVVGLLQGMTTLPHEKARRSKRNDLTKWFQSQFRAEPKTFPLDTPEDAMIVARYLANQRAQEVQWRTKYPYMLVHTLTWEASHGEAAVPAAENVFTVRMSGYLRGNALSANQLAHVPGIGDFQLRSILRAPDPCPFPSRRQTTMDTQQEESVDVLDVCDPRFQESLDREYHPDPLEGEQTWPTEEEMQEAQGQRRVRKRRIKGFSDYQMSWIVESDNEEDLGSEDEPMADGEVSLRDHENVEGEEDGKGKEEEGEEEEEEEEEEVNTYDGLDVDNMEGVTERHLRFELQKREKEDMEFPDEVDTPMDVPARVRFQRYRGLKSFRTSPWNPKENLPREYARICQFENFARTQRRVLREHTGVASGQYITIELSCVSQAAIEIMSHRSPLVVAGLLLYEQKLSVLHFLVQRHSSYEDPVKAKETLVIHYGFRRFPANPIFSEDTRHCDKQKMEQFLQAGGRFSIASIYGPVGFLPASCLMTKTLPLGGGHALVATGSLQSVNPDKIILKRIILSGYPIKCYKKRAAVRFMFFNPEDIAWFKPIELWTKRGRIGRILDSLGTHGYMKCSFDGNVGMNDTVCMTLYKRAYPKWPGEL